MSEKFLRFSLIILAGIACHETTVPQAAGDWYADVLNLKKLPHEPSDHETSIFSDLGAWFGYALNPEPTGGFTGPFVMSTDNGIWFSQSLSNLSISVENRPLDYAKAKKYQTYALPGRLLQSFEIEGLQVEQQLIFISPNTSLINTKIFNASSRPMKATLTWHGVPWAEEEVQSSVHRSNAVEYRWDGQQIFIQAPADAKASVMENAYQLTSTIHLGDAPVSVGLTHTLLLPDSSLENEQLLIGQAFENPQLFLASNQARWQQMVHKVTSDVQDAAYKILAVKALETLTNNWRSAAGELQYQGLFPSYAYRGFYGFWSWDSWKHAVALAEINPALAKDQIRAMYEYQDEHGMIADCIFRDATIENHNWRNTKPPLSGWAIYEVFKATNDTAFVKEMYPKLNKYHRWWCLNRDHDKNGLCEYGSADGTREAAAWESGMDNAVRFDSATMMKNSDHAWSLSQESVDLNAYLYAEKNFMIKLANVADQPTQQLEQEAKGLKQQIQEVFYDSISGFFYDVNLTDKEKIKIKGSEGWIPLWAEVASDEQARRVAENLMDTALFNTHMPLPTLDASHAKFNPRRGYWRGPVWIDQAHFAIDGLKNYGHDDYSNQLKAKLLRNGEGMLKRGMPIRENYHPITGEGLNAHHFSWSAAHILLMLKE